MVPQPSSPTQTNMVDEDTIIGGMDGANTTGPSLDAGQGSVNIIRTPTMATPIVSDPFGLDTSGGIPSHMEQLGGSGVLPGPTREETESMPS